MDGDGYTNLEEMLCGLNPTLNSRPEVGDDPKASSAPVVSYDGLSSVSISFDVNATFIGVARNGGAAVTFGGELLGVELEPVGTVLPSLIGPGRYQISTSLDPNLIRFLRLQVIDPNGDPEP